MDIEDMSLESLKNHVKRLEEKEKLKQKEFPIFYSTDEDSEYFGFKCEGENVILIDKEEDSINDCIDRGLSLIECYTDNLPEGFKFVVETNEDDDIKIFLRRV